MTDVVTMQVIRYALEQIADKMGHTLVRSGRSTIITEIKDISCVVTDAKGQTVAQAHHTPSLLAGFEITMRELVKAYRPEDLAPGDVIVTMIRIAAASTSWTSTPSRRCFMAAN
jgi:N-methylhydantoinase B